MSHHVDMGTEYIAKIDSKNFIVHTYNFGFIVCKL